MSLKESYNTGDNVFIAVYNNNWVAQTFIASQNYSIVSVKLLMYKVGAPGTITVSIRDTSVGLPIGGDLCSGTIDGNGLPTASPYQWGEITFDSPAPLIDGVKYAIVVRTSSTYPANYVGWRAVNPGAYANGLKCVSGNQGASWSGDAAIDMMFENYGYLITNINVSGTSSAIADSDSIATLESVPSITYQTDSQGVVLNSEFMVFVVATGIPEPEYQWYKNNGLLVGEISNELIFFVIDSAVYKCRVYNINGEVWSNDIIVTVVENPYRRNIFNMPLDLERENL